MRGDEEMGAVVTAQIIEEEGPSRDSDTNAGGESGQGGFSAGEPGGDGDWGEHGKPVLEVCEARATKGGCGRQRWTFRVPAGEGGGGESDEGGVEEGQESPHIR